MGKPVDGENLAASNATIPLKKNSGRTLCYERFLNFGIAKGTSNREKEGRFIVKRTGDMNRKSVVRNVRTGDRCELTFFNESSYQTVLH